MNRKKWLAAIGIIGLLAIAFFWSGNNQKSSITHEKSNLSAQVIQETTKPELTEEPQKEASHETASPQLEEQQMPVPSETVKAIRNQAEWNKPTAVIDNQPDKTPSETIEAKPEPQLDNHKATETTQSAPQAQGVSPASSLPPKSSTVSSSKPASQATAKPDKSTTASDTKKDQYLTDPVPQGKPKPVEWQNATIDKKKKLTVTLSVTCAAILDNMDAFNKDKLEVLPTDGVIYKSQKVTFYEGESVFDVLLREMRANKIHMEFSMTPIYNSNYIEGINNIYEFDCGELSGWMYKVNDWFPNYGSSRYKLKDGDVVNWVYTCDLGRDIGGDQAAAGAKG